MRSAALAVVYVACAGVAPRVGGAVFEDFVGDWRGALRLPSGAEVAVSLEVVPVAGVSDRFHWRLRYEGQAVRDYVLVVRDRVSGEAALDENNGIVLPVLLRGEELISVFEVQGALLNVRYGLQGDELAFSLESFRREGAAQAGEGVRGWPQVAVQRGRLRRR